MIKMSPVLKELNKKRDIICTKVVFTGQHKDSLQQLSSLFAITPDFFLDVMQHNQSLAELTAKLITNIDKIVLQEKPDWIVAQGDTTSVFVAALIALYHKIKFAHIEAGLRTFDKYSPFPEEFNRFVSGYIADVHFAPTAQAVENLKSEKVESKKIILTGNTGIDALLDITNTPIKLDFKVPDNKKIILITTHRRENFNELDTIFKEILNIATTYPDVHIFYPVHMNAMISKKAYAMLANIANIELLPPLDYINFVHLMKMCDLILTDSGGVQEEAPTFGIPVLIMRKTTERPEGVQAGVAKLIGNKNILEAFTAYHQNNFAKHNIPNPYGDGKAAQRIVDFFLSQC